MSFCISLPLHLFFFFFFFNDPPPPEISPLPLHAPLPISPPRRRRRRANRREGPPARPTESRGTIRSEEHTSELQSPCNLVCRLLLEKKKKHKSTIESYTDLSSHMYYTLSTNASARISIHV